MKKIKIAIIIIFSFICLFGIIYATYNIITWKNNVSSNDKINTEIIKNNITISDNPQEDKKYIVDFEKLKSQNADAIAYLKVNNTNIDYIAVRGSDNSYYLNHNFNREWNVAGWIFADYKNKFDNTDKNIIFYGHNTKNGSMFGTLKDTLTKEWQTNIENLQITLVTIDNTSIYQVFSTYIIENEDYYIKTDFKNDEEYLTFLKNLKNRSNYDYNIVLNIDDTILTLSTCDNTGNKRIVLHAKKMA